MVLLDIGMPLIDGYEVARRVRASLGNTVALVALTGYGDSEARERSRQAGGDRHLVKPIEPDELLRVLAEPRDTAA